MKAKKLFIRFMVGVLLLNASSMNAFAAATTVTTEAEVTKTIEEVLANQDTTDDKDSENATIEEKEAEETKKAEEEKKAEEAKKAEEEKKAKEAEEKAKEEEKKEALAKKKAVADKKKQAEYNAQVKLLAALIETEAGNQGYKGKVAVANVVLNRVGNKKITAARIENVIRAKGQFSVVRLGTFDKALKRYNTVNTAMERACIKAAKAALDGENYVGKRLYFTRYSKSLSQRHKSGIKIQDHLFW